MLSPITALIGVAFGIPRPESYRKSALTFGPPVSATAALQCPGVPSIIVPIRPAGTTFYIPPLPELSGFSFVQCLATITWEDAQGHTEDYETEITFTKLNVGFTYD